MKYLVKLLRYILKLSKNRFSEGERLLIEKEFRIIENSDKWKMFSNDDKAKVIDNIVRILKIGLSR